MNTLPGNMETDLNGKPLKAGSEFLVWAANPAIKGSYRIVSLDGNDLAKPEKLRKLLVKKLYGKFVLINNKGIKDKKVLSVLDSLRYTNFLHAKGLIFVSESKLTWSVMAGYRQSNYTVLDISQNALPGKARKIRLDIESRYFPDYPARNVIGYIRGSVQPDTFLVVTAHYDHLGRMGRDVYFPGANDNGSGTAMLLDLARQYSLPEHRPYYSMVFMCFSGEEAGLNGSTYCADHPPFPLKQVKFLLNLDMVGTGSEGVTMVNATVFKEAYQRMARINADHEYILTVKERGESCNSDHCPFYKKGVPAVFIYSIGKEYSEYHNPEDKSSKLPLTEYKDIFRLMADFLESFHWEPGFVSAMELFPAEFSELRRRRVFPAEFAEIRRRRVFPAEFVEIRRRRVFPAEFAEIRRSKLKAGYFPQNSQNYAEGNKMQVISRRTRRNSQKESISRRIRRITQKEIKCRLFPTERNNFEQALQTL